MSVNKITHFCKTIGLVALLMPIMAMGQGFLREAISQDSWSSAVVFENNGWLGGSGSGPFAIGRFDPRQYMNQIAVVAAPGGNAALFEATSTYSSFMFNSPLFYNPNSGQYTQYAIQCVAVGKVDGRRPTDDVVLLADDWSVYEAYWDSSQSKWVTELIYTDWDAWNGGYSPAFRQIAVGDFDSAHAGLEAVTAGGNSGHVTELYYSSGWQSRRLCSMTDQTPGHSPVNVQSVAVGDFDPANSGDEIVVSRANPYKAIEVYGSGSSWSQRVIINIIDIDPAGGDSVYAAAIGDVDPNRSGNEVYMGTGDGSRSLIEAWWNGNGFSYQVIGGPSVFSQHVGAVAIGDFDPRYPGPEIAVGCYESLYQFRYSGGWQSSLMTNVPNLANGGLLVGRLDSSILGVQVIAAGAHSVRIVTPSGASTPRFKLMYAVVAARDAIKLAMNKAIGHYASLVAELNGISSPIFGPSSAARNWPKDLGTTTDILHELADMILHHREIQTQLAAVQGISKYKDASSSVFEAVSKYSKRISDLKQEDELDPISAALGILLSLESKICNEQLQWAMDKYLETKLGYDAKLMDFHNKAAGVTDKNVLISKIKDAFAESAIESKVDSYASDVVNYINSSPIPSNVDYLVGSLQDFASQLTDIAGGQRNVVVAPRGTSGSCIFIPNLDNFAKQMQDYVATWKAGILWKGRFAAVGQATGWASTVLCLTGGGAAVGAFFGFVSLGCTLAEVCTDVINAACQAHMYLLYEVASMELTHRFLNSEFGLPSLLDSNFLSYVKHYLAADCPDSASSIQTPISWSRYYGPRPQGSALGATAVDITVTIMNAPSAFLLYTLRAAESTDTTFLMAGGVSSGSKSFRSPIDFSWVKGSYDSCFELWVGARRTSMVFQHFDTGIFSSSSLLTSGALKAGEVASLLFSALSASSGTVRLLYKGSQMDLHLYDSQSRHLGVNYVTGAVENNIPGSTYGGKASSPSWVSLPPGTYTVSAVGVSTTSGGLSVPDTAESFNLHRSIEAVSAGVLAVNPTSVIVKRSSSSTFWFDVMVKECTGQNGLSSIQSPAMSLTGPSGITLAANPQLDDTSVGAGGQTSVRVTVSFPSNVVEGTYTGTLHITATGQGGSSPSYNAAIPVSVTLAPGPSLTLNPPDINEMTVTVNGATTPGTSGTTISRISWDWGDGSSEDHWFPASHTYASRGTYTITVTSYQSDDQSTTKSVTVTVTRQVQVTVTSSPAGSGFVTVNGSGITTPQVFKWGERSNQTLSANSPVSGGTGIQYAWVSWSDSGAQSHLITVPSSPTTYTANFKKQYMLTITANPTAGGTLSVSTGWQDNGATVPVSAMTNTGYSLYYWSLDGVNVGSNPSYSVLMNSPHSLTAYFRGTSSISLGLSAESVELGASVTISGTITPTQPSPGIPAGTTVVLSYSLDGSTWNVFAMTPTGGGAYSIVWYPPYKKTYQIKASWGGNSDYGGSTSSTVSLTVTGTPPRRITLLVSGPASKVRGSSVTFDVLVTNASSSMSTTLYLEVVGPGGYRYFDTMQISVDAAGTGRFQFLWQVPSTLSAGQYQVFVGLIPPKPTAMTQIQITVT
jgi:hypothetical protein